MKRRGRHPEKALTAVAVRAASKPGRYADGNGLYLLVEPSGSKSWVLRTVVQGRRRDIGLGGVRLVSLAEAREKATQMRKLAREGGDPLARRRAEQVAVPTFAEAARTVHADNAKGWKNAKHRAQWIASLAQYVFPVFGQKPINLIDTADVLKALSPIWLTKPETARRVRQRIGAVMDWGKAAGFRGGDNPVETVKKALPKQNDRAEHHSALAYSVVPAFVGRLRASVTGEPIRVAFELLILSAVRSGELLNGRWSEVDLDAGLWVIPKERMKAGREHRVPLAPRAVELLRRARELAGDSEFLFTGRSPTRPMYHATFLMTLRRMGESVTAHGFRSAFRDWAAECTASPREIAEAALAHTVRDKVEAAYRRSDLLQKRRQLMEAWANFVDQAGNNVVSLRA